MVELKAPEELKYDKVLLIGRGVLWFLCFCMPLAFCKETMYIFQIKTFLLQMGGMCLLLLLCFHQGLTKGRDALFRHPIAWCILAFLAWQIFKSVDSIAPAISKRNMSRLVWLPIFLWSFLYFIRTREQFEKSINVMIASAFIAYVYAALIFFDVTNAWIFGDGKTQPATLFNLDGWPFGSFFKWFFYPDPLQELLAQKEGPNFHVNLKSFFAGKVDAGTFGNKNFLAAYINMTSVLFLYRGFSLIKNANGVLLKFLVGLVLIIVGLGSFGYLILLENRGSWLGLIAGSLAAGSFLVFKNMEAKSRRPALGSLGLVIILVVSSFYFLNPERFTSIFSMSHGSNELRRHTWVNYLNAWASDDEWVGFENKTRRVLTGFGNYSFRAIYPKVRSERIFQLENNQHNSETTHPHNEYVGLLGELGVMGLLLYLSFVIWMLFLLWKAERQTLLDKFLGAALVFALVSILVHQFVTVGVRYTGLSFQVWLLFALVLWREENKIQQRISLRWLSAPAVFLLAVIAMPNPGWPIQWMRSQHAYEMGQIYFTTLGGYHSKIKSHQGNLNKGIQQLRELERKKSPIPDEFKQRLIQGREVLKNQIEVFEKAFKTANVYFEAGYQLDPANFESIYIGANLNVQFANQDIAAGNFERAKHRFERALELYGKVEKEMPYFVQLRYWQGIVWKGLATLDVKAMEHTKNLSEEASRNLSNRAGAYFVKALGYFDQFELQDPIYKQLFLDRYYCYRYTGQKEKALNQLVAYLINMERSGQKLFSKDKRYDTRSMMGHIMKLAEPEDMDKALVIYRNLLRYYNSSLLLPFVPKTERHIVNSFRLLDL